VGARSRFYLELGFNPRASEGAKRAFSRHLSRVAASPSAENISTSLEPAPIGEQLAFDSALLGPPLSKPNPKK